MIIAEQAQIKLPGGSWFKPDFIAYDPQTSSVVLVESKMGPGARFTPNQLEGYEHMRRARAAGRGGRVPAGGLGRGAAEVSAGVGSGLVAGSARR